MSTPEQKNALVLAVLKAATEPLGPKAIGERIKQQGRHWWTADYMVSAPISLVLKRINAARHPGGKYTAPVEG